MAAPREMRGHGKLQPQCAHGVRVLQCSRHALAQALGFDTRGQVHHRQRLRGEADRWVQHAIGGVVRQAAEALDQIPATVEPERNLVLTIQVGFEEAVVLHRGLHLGYAMRPVPGTDCVCKALIHRRDVGSVQFRQQG